MKDNAALVHESIMRDMTDGVMTIGFDGVITYVNPAAARILEADAQALTGSRFARHFFLYQENDDFNQTVLDAVYDTGTTHRRIVPYYTGTVVKQLHVTTSYLHGEREKIGVIVVMSDISELTELRDAVKAMHKIQTLNHQLTMRNQLLSETFGRYLSDEIVRQLLETPGGLALGGKKQTVTIMMSDLRGFTAISERMEPQSLISMLNHYLGEMTRVIQNRGGTIIEFIGDGIMALFGALTESLHQADDAVAAAIEMQSEMRNVNAWNREKGYPALEMGIGLHTGDVIVGNIGSEKRTKYGVVGSHVNLCGRIESYTVGGQVLISPDTRNMLTADCEILSEQKVMPKGVKEPIVISEVAGLKAPYNVYFRKDLSEIVKLKAPAKVRFRTIAGKHVSEGYETGVITHISRMGAVLSAGDRVQVYDNLLMDIGAELFAKAVSMEEDGVMIRFTSVPPEFDAWFDGLVAKV